MAIERMKFWKRNRERPETDRLEDAPPAAPEDSQPHHGMHSVLDWIDHAPLIGHREPDADTPLQPAVAKTAEALAPLVPPAPAHTDPAPARPSSPAPDTSPTAPAIMTQPVEKEAGWLSRLSSGLSKSTGRFTEGLTSLVTKRRLDQEMLDQLEEMLITADLGPHTAAHVVETFGRDRFGKDLSEDDIRSALATGIAEILAPVAVPLEIAVRDGKPMVVLVCGVNGVGKTTTIGKIAYDMRANHGKRVMIAAGDTFRAAAVEQLEIWAKRAGCELVKKDIGADAAAVAYEAYERACAANAELLMIDTAGRLHNKSNLMAELEKIVRVLKKHDPALPHAVLLVLDATTGQNALEQVRIFKEMVDVTGLVVTKLDGSSKGGIVVALADQFKLPIHFIGVGEQQADLQPFAAEDYARSLVGLKTFGTR